MSDVRRCPGCNNVTTRRLCLSCTNSHSSTNGPQLYVVPNVDKFLGQVKIPGSADQPKLLRFPEGYINLGHYGVLWYIVRPWYWLYTIRFLLGYLIMPAPYKTYIRVFNEQVLKSVARGNAKRRSE